MSAREPGIERQLACHSERSEEPLKNALGAQEKTRVASASALALKAARSATCDCEVLVVCATRDEGSQCAAKVLEAIQPFFDDVDTGRVTEPDSAIVAEGGSRNDRDVGFT